MDDLPPNLPPAGPSEVPPNRRGLNRGVPAGVERGPDGRLRRKAPAEGEEPAEWSAESQSVLDAMRHVCRRPASKDDTYEHREYRAWLKEDRKGFMSKRSDLERAALTAAGRAPAPAEVGKDAPLDDGEERVKELIERLLGGYP